jgi:ParB family chromosome partitioning protein
MDAVRAVAWAARRARRLRGLLQPLVVSPNGGDDFRLVAGERRYRAAALASLTEVPVIVRQVSEDTRGLDDALVENMTRKDLDAVEEAKGFQRLLDGGLTRKGVAGLLGVSQKLIGDRLQSWRSRRTCTGRSPTARSRRAR